MTDGGYTMEEARAFQGFTGRSACEEAADYDGSNPPGCHPVCEACVDKWLACQDHAPNARKASN